MKIGFKFILNLCRNIALVVAGMCLAIAITLPLNMYFFTDPVVYDYFSKPKLLEYRDGANFIAGLVVAFAPHLVLVFLFRKFNKSLFFLAYVTSAIVTTAPFVLLYFIAYVGFGGPHPGP
jgi:hypothetical protein